jgi:mono/diheme cytochrome c family protein
MLTYFPEAVWLNLAFFTDEQGRRSVGLSLGSPIHVDTTKPGATSWYADANALSYGQRWSGWSQRHERDSKVRMTAFAPLVLLALVVLVAATALGCGSAAPTGTASADRVATTGSPAGGSPATTASGSVDPSSLATAVAQGQSAFNDNCARCHGVGGQGVTGPNLQHETDLSKVENQIRNGGQIMPSFGGQLSDAQISAVAQYVLSFAGK